MTPRQAGPRWPCGRLKQPSGPARQRQLNRQEAEIVSVVLAQPHRRGNLDQLAADALGRFVLRMRFRREFYDAAQAYKRLRLRFLQAFGAPLQERLESRGTVRSSGAGPSWREIRRWSEELARIDRDLSPFGWAWGALKRLVDGEEFDQSFDVQIGEALKKLAEVQGLWNPKSRPFL